MPQSNVIFAFLFVGFLLWVTVKGELATYIGYLLNASQCDAGNTSTASANTSDNVNPDLATAAQAVAAAGAFV